MTQQKKPITLISLKSIGDMEFITLRKRKSGYEIEKPAEIITDDGIDYGTYDDGIVHHNNTKFKVHIWCSENSDKNHKDRNIDYAVLEDFNNENNIIE
jgi:hypothetical protein